MLSHVMLGSNDIERSRRFYDATLAVVGCLPGVEQVGPAGHARLFYRHGGHSFSLSEPIDDQPGTHSNGGTIGFTCETPEQVQRFHDVAVASGGTSIEDPPGWRGDKMVYLAYIRDPDGHKLCAIKWA